MCTPNSLTERSILAISKSFCSSDYFPVISEWALALRSFPIVASPQISTLKKVKKHEFLQNNRLRDRSATASYVELLLPNFHSAVGKYQNFVAKFVKIFKSTLKKLPATRTCEGCAGCAKSKRTSRMQIFQPRKYPQWALPSSKLKLVVHEQTDPDGHRSAAVPSSSRVALGELLNLSDIRLFDKICRKSNWFSIVFTTLLSIIQQILDRYLFFSLYTNLKLC